MSKIFSTVRIDSIFDKNFNRYFLYVFGEIVLVVIGILIALQIDNQNKVQEASKKEILYLQSFQEDLRKDIGLIKDQLEAKEFLFSQLEEVFYEYPNLQYRSEEELLEISSRLALITSQFNFVCSCSTFEAIQNSSDIQVITDFSLVQLLFNYYTYSHIISTHDELSNQYIRNIIEPYIFKKLELRSIDYVAEWYENDNRKFEKRLSVVYSDYEFENILIGSRDRTEEYLAIYKRALMLAQELYVRLDEKISARTD
tara:strand:- start:18 stop:785 length:768 start_codon:yes stop_codon:yes gene_type:complete